MCIKYLRLTNYVIIFWFKRINQLKSKFPHHIPHLYLINIYIQFLPVFKLHFNALAPMHKFHNFTKPWALSWSTYMYIERRKRYFSECINYFVTEIIHKCVNTENAKNVSHIRTYESNLNWNTFLQESWKNNTCRVCLIKVDFEICIDFYTFNNRLK